MHTLWHIVQLLLGLLYLAAWVRWLIGWVRSGCPIPRLLHYVAIGSSIVGAVAGTVIYGMEVFSSRTIFLCALLPPVAVYAFWFFSFGPQDGKSKTRAKTPGTIDAPFDPAAKLYESADDSVLQVGKDFFLYGLEGRAGTLEEDKVFFKDLERIKVTRTKKSGRVTSINYKIKGTLLTTGIDGFTDAEMEDIAGLLETRIKGSPIQFLEIRSDLSTYVRYGILATCAIVLIIIGIATYRVFFGS